MSELRCQPPLLQLLSPPISQRRVHVVAAAAIALLLHGRICRLRLHAALLICVLSQASTHDAVNRLSRLRAPWLLAVEGRPPRVSSYTLLSAAYLAACAARWWLPAAAGVLLQLVIAALSAVLVFESSRSRALQLLLRLCLLLRSTLRQPSLLHILSRLLSHVMSHLLPQCMLRHARHPAAAAAP